VQHPCTLLLLIPGQHGGPGARHIATRLRCPGPAQVQDHQTAQAAREATLRSLAEDRSRLDAALSSIQVGAWKTAA
jgi:hypothetical protein